MKTKIFMQKMTFLFFCSFFLTLLHGEKVITSEDLALWSKFANSGDVEAQLLLGNYYMTHKNGEAKREEGEKWFRKAAEQGSSVGQYGLGLMAQNDKEAFQWFLKAAEQGEARSQNLVGLMLREGKGVKKDDAEAAKWFLKAAEQGYAAAQNHIGLCYKNGAGLGKDLIAAAEWFRMAALQEHSGAQYNLGGCYVFGEGVVKDEVEAYKWWLLAASKGDVDAQKNMAVSEKRLTRDQIAEGQKLARNFKPQKAERWGQQRTNTSPSLTGTGFFITEDGYLLTNLHVVNKASDIRLSTSDGLIAAKLVNSDAANDLALLKAEGNFAALPVVSSSMVKLGSSVITVGFPNVSMQGHAPKLAKGEIASLTGANDDPRYFQISVPLQPGNSGGALVDDVGNVVGIVTAKLNASAALAASGALPENVNYAIKSSFLLGFIEAVPDIGKGMLDTKTNKQNFEANVENVKKATVLIVRY